MLTVDDASRVLEEIMEAQNRAFQLGLHLNLKPHEVQSICTQYRDPSDQLLYVLIEALKKVPPLTWRRIADALRSSSVGLPRLAEKIETAHCK